MNSNEIMKAVDKLEPMPRITNKVLGILEDPECSMQEIADIIMYDPVITGSLLKICNSAYFNLPRKVESVQEAVMLLGLDQITDLILLKWCSKNMEKSQKGYCLGKGELWKHSVSCALLAKDLCGKKGYLEKHQIFTAALLMDIGKVILDNYVSDSIHKIFKMVQENGLSFMEAEKKVIGIDHAEIGGIVAEKWEFSPSMIDLIKNHHLTEDNQIENIGSSILYMSDTICMMMGIGIGVDGLAYKFYEGILKKLQITDSDIMEIIAEFGYNMQKVEELIKGSK